MTFDQLLAAMGLEVNPTLAILTCALLMSRIVPVLLLSPMLGGDSTPPEVKIGAGVMFTLVMFPAVADRVNSIPTGPWAFIALMSKEIFIGLSLAFVVSGVFEAARAAGNAIDSQSGAAQAQVHVPQIQEQVSIFSTFQFMLAVALFLTLDGHHVVIEGLADSLVDLPLDRFPQFSRGFWGFFELILRVFRDMMRLGVVLAAPAIVASLLSEVALGLMNRVAPQMNVYFIAMAIKPLVATVVLWLAVPMILLRMSDSFRGTLRSFLDAIQMLK